MFQLQGLDAAGLQIHIIFAQIGFRIGAVERLALFGLDLGPLFLVDVDKKAYHPAHRAIHAAAGFSAVGHCVLQHLHSAVPVFRMDQPRPGCQPVGEIQNVMISHHPAELVAVHDVGLLPLLIAVDVPQAGLDDIVHQIQILPGPVDLRRHDPDGAALSVHGVLLVQPGIQRHSVPGQQLPIARALDLREPIRLKKGTVFPIDQPLQGKTGMLCQIRKALVPQILQKEAAGIRDGQRFIVTACQKPHRMAAPDKAPDDHKIFLCQSGVPSGTNCILLKYAAFHVFPLPLPARSSSLIPIPFIIPSRPAKRKHSARFFFRRHPDLPAFFRKKTPGRQAAFRAFA